MLKLMLFVGAVYCAWKMTDTAVTQRSLRAFFWGIGLLACGALMEWLNGN